MEKNISPLRYQSVPLPHSAVLLLLLPSLQLLVEGPDRHDHLLEVEGPDVHLSPHHLPSISCVYEVEGVGPQPAAKVALILQGYAVKKVIYIYIYIHVYITKVARVSMPINKKYSRQYP